MEQCVFCCVDCESSVLLMLLKSSIKYLLK